MSWQETEENQKYLPGSPHNRIMYFIIEGYSSSLHNLIKYLYNQDNGLEEENAEIPQPDDDQPDSHPPPRKKKKISPCTVFIARSAISKAACINPNQLLNSAQQNRHCIPNLRSN